MFVRRVITGVDAQGRSVVVADERIDGIRPSLVPGSEVHAIWGTDTVPVVPHDGAPPVVGTTYPQAGGVRFGLFNVLPDRSPRTQPDDLAGALAEYEALRPGVLRYFEPGGTGMHTTPTVDVVIVLEGRVWMELDDGVEVALGTGDVIVQNGARHAWRNHADVPARLASVMVGATEAGATSS
ncbi:cupin domain-containing protein [Actinomadura madurae]|uniref:cupin domain-containing protein n=1 Tax=Actinomadura madurae TaxID=1993 RepID=UPI00399B7979